MKQEKEAKGGSPHNPKCHCNPCECGADCVCGFTPEELKAKVDALIAERDNNLNLAKYQKAELENFKRRNADAITNAFRDGQTFVIEAILPVYDGVIEAGKKIANPVDLAGFEIIKRKLEDAFKRLGIEEIATVGNKFDPRLHNAAAVEQPNGRESDLVLEEWQKGFTLCGRVLRPATVKVTD